MLKPSSLAHLITALLALSLASCQSTTKTGRIPSKSTNPHANSGEFDTQLEISYVLGHDSHLLLARSKKDEVTAFSYRNQELIKEGQIDPSRYRELLNVIASFVSHFRKPASQNFSSIQNCRGSFTVTLRQAGEIQTLHGCRSQELGTDFSRITRDAEYLLYSKK